MGWFGKIVGGGVGALVGGPAGAAIGFGLGSAFDSAVAGDDAGVGEGVLSGAQATTLEDEAGVAILLQTVAPFPDSVSCLLLFYDENGKALQAGTPTRCGYSARNGHLCILAEVQDNLITAYLPAGAVPRRVPRQIVVLVRVILKRPDGSFVPLGQRPFRMDAPTPQEWSQIKVIQPLISLGMRVARADGQLLREEIRHLRDYLSEQFELTTCEQQSLREAMKATDPGVSNYELVEAVHRRLPYIEWTQVLAALAGVARCDGEVSESEVAVIREIAVNYYGSSVEHWREIQEVLGLAIDDSTQTEDDHWAVLSISPGASAVEIKKAYHRKMRDYHPDKVSNLPKEFQELAHQKTIEIRTAYEALLRRTG